MRVDVGHMDQQHPVEQGIILLHLLVVHHAQRKALSRECRGTQVMQNNDSGYIQ